MGKQFTEDENLKVDKTKCLKTLQKIKQGDFSGFSEIEDVRSYIEKLKEEISDPLNEKLTLE